MQVRPAYLHRVDSCSDTTGIIPRLGPTCIWLVALDRARCTRGIDSALRFLLSSLTYFS